jgi:hypothetical protein
MMKYARTLTAAVLALALAPARSAGQAGQIPSKPAAKAQTSDQPSAMDYRRDAMGTFDQMFPEMTALMALASMEPTKTTKPWDDLVNDRCHLWSLTVDQAEIVMREKSQTPAASWQEWRKDNEEFIANEIQSAGREVMSWRQKTYTEIFSLQWDIDFHPVRKDEWLKTMNEAEKILETAEGTVNDAAAPVGVIEKSRIDVRQAKSLVDNVASDLDQIRKRVVQNHGAELKMDAKIAAIQARWTGLQDLYPHVVTTWKMTVSGWTKNIKSAFESHEKTRKQFDTLYEPVMNQKLFAGLRLFQGKEYKDLAGVVDRVDQALQVRWVKAKDKSQKDEDISKAMEKERLASDQERKRYWELYEIASPARARQEWLTYNSIVSDLLKDRELELKSLNLKNTPAEQKAAEADLKKYRDKGFPDQIAAQKAWDEYQKQQKSADAEMTRIMTDRAARLKKLGLPPEPDWPVR